MELCSIIISVLRRFPPGIWVPLGQTVEGGLKSLTSPPASNVSINYDITLSQHLVLLREGGGPFISPHHSLQVTKVAARHYSK